MKKFLFSAFILLLAIGIQAQADAISKYFDKYSEDEGFSVVYISSKMFEYVSKIDIEDMSSDVKDVISNLKGLRILTREHDGKKYYNEVINTLNPKEYETLMTVRDGDENVRFWVKENPGNSNVIDELLLLVGGDEFVLMSFVGKIDLSKIGKIANDLDIDGMKHLKKIEKN